MKTIKQPKLDKDFKILPLKHDGEQYYVESFGYVSAGFPSPANDFEEERISIDERYLFKKESTFIAYVGGLSGYPEYEIGDILILRSDYELLNNDDALISVNNSEYTLKRINTKEKLIYAINPEYKNSIKIQDEDVVITLGVVDAIIRDKGRKRRK